MKGLLIVTLAALAISQTYANPIGKCPAEDGEDDVLLPNAADCSSFYKCLAGVPTVMYCPTGLHWSAELNRCEYPDTAKCTETETEAPIETTSALEPTETPITKPPVERPDHCPAEDGPDDVLLPNPADCSSFFKCLNGVPIELKCPAGQEWANDLQRCDYPEIAKCTVTGTKPPVDPTSGPEPTEPPATKPPVERPDHCPAEDGPDDVLLPNPADCSSFFKCLNGVPIELKCPAGQEWANDLQRCDYPEIAKCTVTATKPPVDPTSGPEPTESPVTKPPVERPDHCPAHDGPDDVLLPNPEDCGSFFKCLNGNPVKIDCPVNQEWANDLQRCDFPEIAKCSAIVTKPPMKSTSVPKLTEAPVSKSLVDRPNKCPPEDGPEDVLLPNPDDCGSFFKCNRGEPILEQCPAGLHWSVETNQCDYPENAKCQI